MRTAGGVLTSSDAFARVVFLDLEKGASFKLSMAGSTATAAAECTASRVVVGKGTGHWVEARLSLAEAGDSAACGGQQLVLTQLSGEGRLVYNLVEVSREAFGFALSPWLDTGEDEPTLEAPAGRDALKADDETPPRVAVIGAGIGGAAASHFLQQALRNESRQPATISVFERSNYVGGRLKHAEFGGGRTHVELGGAAWTTNNHWMAQLADEMGVNHTTTDVGSSGGDLRAGGLSGEIGVWNGTSFAGVVDLLARRALSELRLAAAESEFLTAIQASYRAQEARPPFETVDEFLSEGWGNLRRFTSVSIADFFRQRGVREDVIRDGMVPLTRAIYNRNGGADAFALLASLTAELSHHQVRAGNSELVEALLRHAGAHVSLSTGVREIAERPHGGGFALTAEDGTALGEFDAVIIAAPLERSNITIVPADGQLPPTARLDRGFTEWFVTVVEAEALNTKQFGGAKVAVDPKDCTVLTTAVGTTAETPCKRPQDPLPWSC